MKTSAFLTAEPAQRFKAGVERVILRWLKREIAEKYNLQVRDMDKSWRDGVLFNALVHRFFHVPFCAMFFSFFRCDGSLIDMHQVREQAPRQNLEQAFDKVLVVNIRKKKKRAHRLKHIWAFRDC